LIQRNIFLPKTDSTADAAKVDVRGNEALARYEMAVSFLKPPHQPHMENFFNAIRGTGETECPRTSVSVANTSFTKANEAIPRKK